jgi:hypothetical protein
MILFPVYAVFIWYFCLRWRRNWVGWASLLMGVSGVGVVAWFHQTVNSLMAGAWDGPLFPILLASEAGLVLVVGVFIVLLPIEVAEVPCRRCHYDLAGLEEDNPTCPECGMPHAARKVRRCVCRGCGAEMFVERRENPDCASCGLVHAVRPVAPPRTPVLVTALRALLQPRISRYTAPRSSTPSGIPKIVVIRKPDSTFVSMG